VRVAGGDVLAHIGEVLISLGDFLGQIADLRADIVLLVEVSGAELG
jgi:hypothetical protein